MPPHRRFPEGGDWDRRFGMPLPPGAPLEGFQASARRIHDQAASVEAVNQLPLEHEPSRAPGATGRIELGHLGVAMAQLNPNLPPPSAGEATA